MVPNMKKFLKWAAIGIGFIILLMILDGFDKETRRWLILWGGAGWFAMILLNKVEKIQADLSKLQSLALSDLHNLKKGIDRCEEMLEQLREKAG